MTTALAALREEKHISISSLQTYLRCPAQYFYRYVMRVRDTHRPGALAFGTAIHTALACFYTSLMKGEEISSDELVTCFADAWEEQLSGDLPVLLSDKESPGSLQDMGVEMLNCFHRDAPRPHRVVGVEEPFAVDICHPSSDVPFPERLVGVFDAVIQQEDGSYSILEHKTAARRFTKSRLDHDLQVTGYTLAAPLVGLPGASVTFQVLLKTSKPALELYQPSRTKRDQEDFQRTAAGVLAAVQAGAFYPVRDWWCSGCSSAGPCVAG